MKANVRKENLVIVNSTLAATLKHWQSMSGAKQDELEAESTANEFEAAFYTYIDAVRAWIHGLEPQPQTLEEALELPLVQQMVDQLPTPLYLNFETELELIIEHKNRVDDEKYD
ncbi:hypothetical protein [Paenibacillus agricola]|uniref:Uncharacterized protein n=1 Tax=Paenibacillus agricola TaxID=2716264 RepID=A0ABX0JD67_9BACL|nr:hypothetical protein [Paenibacillus agricola]NHN34432.1 hypothetical protein [Paenibacillus agricola]